ncbi:triple tyrosine motif-containing protein [Bacillus massilinigeriensis]|uniref:triple tyrosine motif-containing protein n=1 Tax=Bacillus massilionigeriensis TaxID=1805475 RepID=UPI00096B4DD6|nr:triple tyrosine motif-containing protein [Bacillus massilionigeriensis]
MRKYLLTFSVIFCFLISAVVPAAQAETSFSKASTNELEPNETKETATVMDLATSQSGTLTNDQDVDYYQINMPLSGTFSLSSYLGNEELDNEYFYYSYHVKIYNSLGELIKESDSDYGYDEVSDYYYYLQALDNIELEKGTYYLSVQSDNENVGIENQSYQLTPKVEYHPDFSLKSITPSVKSPYVNGKTIKLTANSDTANLEYQFRINNTVVQSFSTNKVYQWKPSKAGKYTIKVEARKTEFPNTIVSKTLSYEIKDGKVTISSLVRDKTSPRPTSTTIKWTARASGMGLEYKFSVYKNKKWSTLQNYSTKSYAYWKPKTAGTYKVRVTVRSKVSGKSATKDSSSFTIYKPSSYSITSLKSSLKSPQKAGRTFYISGKAKGSYLEYRYRVYNGYSWYTIKDYSSSKTLYWTPYARGNYKIALDVRQKGSSRKKTKYLSFTIKDAPNFYVRYTYNYYSNYGTLYMENKGYRNLRVTKIEFKNGKSTIYSYSPKSWYFIARSYGTYYFYPKKALSKYTWGTVVRVHYTYDGIKDYISIYQNN